MNQSLKNRISERAYEIWAAHGRADGQADQHWLAAEREVLRHRRRRSPENPHRKRKNPLRRARSGERRHVRRPSTSSPRQADAAKR